MRIADLMKTPAITIPAAAGIPDAAARMRQEDTGFLVVLDGSRVVGVLTDRDIVARFVAVQGPSRPDRVADIMSREVRFCAHSETIETAAAMMGDHQVRRLPVCDARGRLVGTLSLDRIAEHYSEHLAGETLGEIVETR